MGLECCLRVPSRRQLVYNLVLDVAFGSLRISFQA
jgi:hypothetical protein